MGLKKIVMLTFGSVLLWMHTLHPSDCHKTTATGSCSSGRWDDQDEWGRKRGESELQLMPNLMSRITGKGKNAGCIWNSLRMARR